MNNISETNFLYWLYNKIEIIKDRNEIKNEIKNIKDARNTINEIKNKLIYIPECYRMYFEQELKDVKYSLKRNPKGTYAFLYSLNILIDDIIEGKSDLQLQ